MHTIGKKQYLPLKEMWDDINLGSNEKGIVFHDDIEVFMPLTYLFIIKDKNNHKLKTITNPFQANNKQSNTHAGS